MKGKRSPKSPSLLGVPQQSVYIPATIKNPPSPSIFKIGPWWLPLKLKILLHLATTPSINPNSHSHLQPWRRTLPPANQLLASFITWLEIFLWSVLLLRVISLRSALQHGYSIKRSYSKLSPRGCFEGRGVFCFVHHSESYLRSGQGDRKRREHGSKNWLVVRINWEVHRERDNHELV